MTASLFGVVRFTESADLDKYSCSGYGIEFDTRKTISLSDGSGFGKSVITFGFDNSYLNSCLSS